MRIRILAIGDRMPDWVNAACAEYAKRLPREFSVRIDGLATANRAKARGPSTAIRRESAALLQRVDTAERVVALDVLGDIWSTEQLAKRIEAWRMDGRNVSLLVGGADGLHDDCLQRAETRWSLSRLTLPHPLVRVVLLEQLYRAWTIISGHPYHRS